MHLNKNESQLRPLYVLPKVVLRDTNNMVNELFNLCGMGESLTPEKIYYAVTTRSKPPIYNLVSEKYSVLGLSGESPKFLPKRGDVLVQVALGEPGLGSVSILSEVLQLSTETVSVASLNNHNDFSNNGIYANVIGAEAYINYSNNEFPRQILDANGRVPQGQILLRPHSPETSKILDVDGSQLFGEATRSRNLQKITHAGPYRLAYDRYKDLGRYNIKANPTRSFRGLPTLQVALDKWAEYLKLVLPKPPKYILTAGLYTDKPGEHGRGNAIDVDGFYWSKSEKFVTLDAPKNWFRYLTIEASLRKVFGTVLNYDWNKAHEDHWHCDLGRSTRWRGVRSQALYAQRTLNEIWKENLKVDGKWGSKSKAAALRHSFDFSNQADWDRFLDSVIQGQSIPKPNTTNTQKSYPKQNQSSQSSPRQTRQTYSKSSKKVSKPIPEVAKQYYPHGAFMGAARELLADPKWSRILRGLMPDVYQDVCQALRSKQGSAEIIPMFENNPVAAAYGLIKTLHMDQLNVRGRSNRIQQIKSNEWDAFFEPILIQRFGRAASPEERDIIARKLVDTMLIAHGDWRATIKENKSIWRQYNNVRRLRKSNFGGTLPRVWIDVFGRALALSKDSHWKNKIAEYEDKRLHPRVNSRRNQALNQTFQNIIFDYKKTFQMYQNMFSKNFAVILDVKSRDVTPLILKAVVKELNRRLIAVYGVGSFVHNELSGLKHVRQVIDGREILAPQEIKFFHYAGNLQRACLNSQIQNGDNISFNAGSLIDYDKAAFGKSKQKSYKVKNRVISELRKYKRRYQFNLGVYVQEYDIDNRAASMITELVNQNQDIFNRGFCWGGIVGLNPNDIKPSLTNATVGTAYQGAPGTGARHWEVGL